MDARLTRSSAASTGMIAAVGATTVLGATAIVVQYRIFQGPDTHQLLLVRLFAMPCTAVAWLPAALIGAAAGRATERHPSRGGLALVTLSAVVALSATLAAIGWACDHLGWGRDLFEVSASLGLAGAVTGAVTALVVVHAARATLALNRPPRFCIVRFANSPLVAPGGDQPVPPASAGKAGPRLPLPPRAPRVHVGSAMIHDRGA